MYKIVVLIWLFYVRNKYFDENLKRNEILLFLYFRCMKSWRKKRNNCEILLIFGFVNWMYPRARITFKYFSIYLLLYCWYRHTITTEAEKTAQTNTCEGEKNNENRVIFNATKHSNVNTRFMHVLIYDVVCRRK